jgi:23S rRNA pseudouridine1911/1915/1917 synthase
VVRAKAYLRQKHNKPGNVYIGVVSRLDALVTGVIALARTSKGAARLSEQFREGDVGKTYWAVVEGLPRQLSGTLVNRIAKDEQQRKMLVVGSQGQEARLRFRRLAALSGNLALLEVQLDTGRKHQIRVQLAHHGCPIVGDVKYGASRPFPAGIALHARRLAIMHPTLQTPLEFVAPLPDTWRSLQLSEAEAVQFETDSLQ